MIITAAWPNSESPFDSDLQEEIEREANRREYKNRCGEPKPPSLKGCELAKWKLQMALDCKKLRDANTKRWWNGVDEVHDPKLEDDLNRQIEKARRDVEKQCEAVCD